MADINQPESNCKAALRGEPSYVWRAGQDRRLEMIRKHGAGSIRGKLLVNGTGLGKYQARLTEYTAFTVGLDIEFQRLLDAKRKKNNMVCAAGEHLPFPPDYFTAILSNEVIEHVEDDRMTIEEIVRTLEVGGRLILFCPNRGYPYETHGIYWREKYRFGNKLFVNYLPRSLRNRLAPHVRVYIRKDLENLFTGLPLMVEVRTTIFGAYDNIIERIPAVGKALRALLYFLEKTPFNRLGLSHFWVLRKTSASN